MKGKICSLSAASFLLLAAAGSVHAQTTVPAAACPSFPLNKRGVATTPFRYTVNYAVSNPESAGSLGTPGAETAIHIINRHPSAKMAENCIYVLFKDKDGLIQGVAQGTIPKDGSKIFATNKNPLVSNYGFPPPFLVDYPAADPLNTSAPMEVPLEGRAEIYAKNPSLQVAPFVVDHGAMTVVPVQRHKTATGNN